MVTPQDIEIFIAAYKRPAYLKQALESLLAQTVKGFKITVLDNSPDSDTETAVKPYLSKDVEYIRTLPAATAGRNTAAAREKASKSYVMLFHDDDRLHPEFVEKSLKIINHFKDVDLITGKCSNFYDENIKPFPAHLANKVIILKDKPEFAAYLYAYGKGGANTPGTFYKTEYFKTADTMEKFHKNGDWPFCVEALEGGRAFVIDDKYAIYTRQHAGQDSNASETNGTDTKHLFLWMDYFASYLKPNDNKSPYYKMYRVYTYNILKGLYNYLKPSAKEQNPWPKLLQDAKNKKIIDDAAIKYGNYRKSILARFITAPYRFKNKLKIKTETF